MNKERLFRELVDQSNTRDKYLESVPSDLFNSVIDNAYVNSITEERDMMLKMIFGEHAEAVEWFLYEWQPGYEVSCNGVTIAIHSIDAYIHWMQENEGF